MASRLFRGHEHLKMLMFPNEGQLVTVVSGQEQTAVYHLTAQLNTARSVIAALQLQLQQKETNAQQRQHATVVPDDSAVLDVYFSFHAQGNRTKWEKCVREVARRVPGLRLRLLSADDGSVPQGACVLVCHVAASQGLYPQLSEEFYSNLARLRSTAETVVLLGLRPVGAGTPAPLDLGDNPPPELAGIEYIEIQADTRSDSLPLTENNGPSLRRLGEVLSR
jgi:hypothetical protein